MNKEEIKKIFDKTMEGFFLSRCVENGTMDKEFYENQLNVFINGFNAGVKQNHVVDEQKRRMAEEIIMMNNDHGITFPKGMVRDAKQYLEGLEG